MFSPLSLLALAAPPPVTPVGGEPVDLEPALARLRQAPEFQPRTSPSDWLERWFPQMTQWLREAQEKLQEAVTRLIRGLTRWLPDDWGRGAQSGLPDWALPALQILAALAAATLLAFALTAAFSYARKRYRRWAASRPAGADAGSAACESARAHRQEAALLAAQGQFEDAVRQLYWASVRELDEAGWAPFDPSRTRLEILARIARRDLPSLTPERRREAIEAARAPFERLSRTFEAVRFGGRALDANGFQRCVAEEAALSQALARAQTSVQHDPVSADD